MAGRPPSDVSEAVREVVGAFDKAVNLVRRIEDRKDGKTDPESVHDLYKSLALGPTIVQGYYDADSKRLGPAYTIGDFTAQMQLRDVLLHLKTLIGELQDVLLDEKQIDFRLLQDASDHCRVNAGVCLGQLSQRMSEARNHNPMFMQSPPAYMSGVPSMHSPSLHYSHSHSPHSSMGQRMPDTPGHYQQQPDFQSWDQKRESDPYYPQHHRQGTDTSLQESFAAWPVSGQYGSQYGDKAIDRRSDRRPSSNILSAEDGALLSPGLPQDQSSLLLPGQQDLVRNSYTSFSADGSLSRHSTRSSQLSKERFGADDFGQRPTTGSSHLSRERFGPDDFGDVGHNDPFGSNRGSTRSVTSYASRANEAAPESSPNLEQVSRPAPLQFGGNRSVSGPQPVRQPSSGGAGAPPSGLIPAIPRENPFQQSQYPGQVSYDPRSIPIPMPTPQSDARGMLPPRSQSLAAPYAMQNPGLFPQSPPLHRVLTDNQARQYSMSAASPYTQQYQPPIPQIPATYQSLDPGHYAPTAQQPLQPPKPDKLPPQPPTAAPPALPVSTPAQPIERTTSITSMAESTRTDSVISVPRPMSVSHPRSPALSSLSLPTEKSSAPFCKGAVRMMIGAKKAFIPAQRPVGMTTVQPYWCCDKCRFEGPMHSLPGPLDKKGRPTKGEKVFDLTARECGPISSAVVGPDGRGEGSGGIRYKWSFLAKCHVPMKSVAEKQDGTAGSFCCIFCVAEGASRGWLGPGQQGFNDGASTFSGKSGKVGGSVSAGTGGADGMGTTRVFGGFASFMDHLQVHRREEMWPGEEMRGRMKCVVGRAASNREEWEINFMPL